MIDRHDEQTRRRIPRHHRVSRVTAVQETFPGIEHQSAFDFVGIAAMAFVTIGLQHWTNSGIKKRQVFGRNRSRRIHGAQPNTRGEHAQTQC